ncbi:hypothetical protein Aph02nite_76510 [Actinoplanes philippinensis]|uniref:Uncharacterized protein n=1 Tax=Actinoplanes philippinensis TaxID=35752 RepID=A0A1I2HHN9_9ACTN|nr:hypothetical protein [Actinoplanes philippinensis]GIE81701.1 hypothetical protein Aph02nite_76510 [Actinoplanes philippinensis]SFF27981.1 hypothetical protein SAMN05421541_10891 [Actinoplanes philippinensis]
MSPLRDWFTPPPVPVALAQFEDRPVIDLASSIEGSYLRAACLIRWVGPYETEAADRLKLRDVVISHARQEAGRYSAAHLETATTAINASLSRVAWPRDTNARDVTAGLRLSADPAVRDAAAEWEKLQTRLRVERLQARLEIERLRHLRDDIFAKPEVARTYWLDKHPTGLEEVLDDRFDRIAEKLASGPGPSTLAVANVIREFLAGLGPEHKAVMMELLQKALADFGRADLAHRLPPDPDGP